LNIKPFSRWVNEGFSRFARNKEATMSTQIAELERIEKKLSELRRYL